MFIHVRIISADCASKKMATGQQLTLFQCLNPQKPSTKRVKLDCDGSDHSQCTSSGAKPEDSDEDSSESDSSSLSEHEPRH